MVKGEFVKGEDIVHNARVVLRLTILRQILRVREEAEQWCWERVSCLRNPSELREVGLPQGEIIKAMSGRWAVREKLRGADSLFVFHMEIETNAKDSLWQKENLRADSGRPFSRDLGLSVPGNI